MNASPPRVPGLPLIPALALGALIGALTVAVFLHLPEFILRMAGGPDSISAEVSSVVLDLLGTALASPWGAIGALAGGAIGWSRFRRRTTPPGEDGDVSLNPDGTPAEAPMRTKAGGGGGGPVLLGFGLALLLVSFGMFPSVMIWMLALWTLPPSVVLLTIGAMRIRDAAASWPRLLGGLTLLLAGMAALGAAALIGTHISYRLSLPAYHLTQQIQRPHEPLPGVADWVRFAGCSLFASVLVGVGLRLWTDWPASRRLRWSAAILLFPLAALLLHRTLVAAGVLPLSA